MKERIVPEPKTTDGVTQAIVVDREPVVSRTRKILSKKEKMRLIGKAARLVNETMRSVIETVCFVTKQTGKIDLAGNLMKINDLCSLVAGLLDDGAGLLVE